MGKKRKRITVDISIAVLTEAGYRCAVPTCRNILALDLHHIVEVSEGGGNALSNLIALCPTCHALYTRGTIKRESIQAWKGMLVALSRAFDVDAVDTLLFLEIMARNERVAPAITGDTVMKYSRLISAGLVNCRERWTWPSATARALPDPVCAGYVMELTPKGKMLIDAWKRGDREALKAALGPLPNAGTP